MFTCNLNGLQFITSLILHVIYMVYTIVTYLCFGLHNCNISVFTHRYVTSYMVTGF